MDLEQLKYPIGKFQEPQEITSNILSAWISSIEQIPSKVKVLTQNLSDTELSKPYRPGGWNIRQVVHHIPDSHLNAYVRLKWALTEGTPTIKAYDEKRWAELFDSKNADIEVSLKLLENLHERLVYLLRNLSETELSMSYYHPEDDETVSVKLLVGKYAWHGEHHLAHIEQALKTDYSLVN